MCTHTCIQTCSDPGHPAGLLSLAVSAQPGLPPQPEPARLTADPQVAAHHSGGLCHSTHPGGDAREGAASRVSVAALSGEHCETKVHGYTASYKGVDEEGSRGEAHCLT